MKEKRFMQVASVRGPKGFTLVEVLIAILIFSLSLLALVPLLSTAASVDRENYLNVRARAMAADTLDQLMGLNCLAGGCSPLPPAELTAPADVVDQGVTFSTATNITQAGNIVNVAVTVQYTYKTQTKTFVLTAQKIQ